MPSIAEGPPKLEERIDKDGAKYLRTTTAVIKPHERFDKEEIFVEELVKLVIKKGKKQFPSLTIR